ncbi:hypothetical protein [Gimesia algae]|uniref:Uncharacterized protein n=1 Tax=Gimesia algae TaxID=2527971 RepID=A0A517VD96_9PLAN|nr:hypothetical protein [Gimesia algae]QDT90969.1 hypothetical protein Pan161_26230 [Gimesia algae]
MKYGAVVMGDPRELLRRGPGEIKDASEFSKDDSNIFAHFIQVQSQINKSKWKKSDIKFQEHGSNLIDASVPGFEDFIFVAAYFRQLFMERKDYLLKDAADRYCKHSSCDIRKAWIHNEVKSFYKILDSPTHPFSINDYTLKQIFYAFIYGAGIMHKIPKDKDTALKRFLDIYDNYPTHRVLYALNVQLRVIMNHVNNIACIIYQDFSYWQSKYNLVLPDVRWHQRLFEINKSNNSVQE